MSTGNPTTSINLVLPRPLIDAVDLVLKGWERFGYVGDRRDVIEALLSYAFHIHRRADEDTDLPPLSLCMKKFLPPIDESRRDLLFDPSVYIRDSEDYDPRDWKIQ